MKISRASGFKMVVIAVVVFSLNTLSTAATLNKSQAADDKVAVVNGRPINAGEFDGEVLKVEKTLLEYGKPLSSGQVSSIRKQVLEAMVRREILYQEGIKSGVKADESAVDKDMEALKKQFPNDAAYKRVLGRMNVTEDSLRSRMEENSVIQQYIEKRFAAKVTVSDNDMVDYYQRHIDIFKEKATDKKPETVLSYESVKDRIRKFLREEKARQEADREAAALRKKADVEILVKDDNASR